VFVTVEPPRTAKDAAVPRGTAVACALLMPEKRKAEIKRFNTGMQSAVHQGLFGVQSPEPFTCPGTCRWTKSHISIGFRAECKDVTQATLETVSCGPENPDDPSDSVTVCTLKTPAGVDLVYHQVLTSGVTTYTMNVVTLLPNSTLQDTFPELTRFAIFRSRDGSYAMFDMNVTDCSLFLTAYEYTGAAANGSEFSFVSRREVDFGVRNPWNIMSGGIDLTGKVYTNETLHKGVRIPALFVDSRLCRTFLPPIPS
jgi:hypothetical protein